MSYFSFSKGTLLGQTGMSTFDIIKKIMSNIFITMDSNAYAIAPETGKQSIKDFSNLIDSKLQNLSFDNNMFNGLSKHDLILAYYFNEISRLQSLYPRIYEQFPYFFSMSLLPVFLDYMFLLTKIDTTTPVKLQEVNKNTISSIIYDKLGNLKIIDNLTGCNINSESNAINIYYVLLSCFLKNSDKKFEKTPDKMINMIDDFIKDLQIGRSFPSSFYVKALTFCGMEYNDNGNRYFVKPLYPAITGAFLMYLWRNNLYITSDGELIKDDGNSYKLQMIEKMINIQGEDSPINRGGITGKCSNTKEEYQSLLKEIESLKKQVEQWKAITSKTSIVTNKKRSDPTPVALESYLSSLESQYMDLKKQIGEVTGDKETWDDEKNKLLARIQQLEDEIKRLNDLELLLKKQLDDCKKELNSRPDPTTLEDLLKEIERLKNQLAEKDNEIALLKEALKNCQEELAQAKAVIAQYDEKLQQILNRVAALLNEARNLQHKTTKLDLIGETIRAIEKEYIELMDKMIKYDVDVTEAVKQLEQKITDEIRPDLVQTDLNEALNTAIKYAKENEAFYYKMVDEITNMLVDSIGKRINTMSGKIMLGQSIDDITDSIMSMLDQTSKLIREFGITSENGTEVDRIDKLVNDLVRIQGSMKAKGMDLMQSRQALVDNIKNITNLLEQKISDLNNKLPNKDIIVNTVMKKIKELQLHYLQNANLATKEIVRRLFVSRSPF